MTGQELVHKTTQGIYLNTKDEILTDSQEYHEFQAASNPTVLGYTFIETVQQRLDNIKKLEDELNPKPAP